MSILIAPCRVLAQAPADSRSISGLTLLEEARSLLSSGSTAGVEPYFGGAADNTPATVAGYFDDIRWILEPGDSAAFAAATGTERTAWLRDFWKERGALGLTGPDERLIAHYQRLEFARSHFSLPRGGRRYQGWERVRTGSAEFDDRGIIYLRHGAPSDVVGEEAGPQVILAQANGSTVLTDATTGGAERGSAVRMPMSEEIPAITTWRYRRPDGDLIFNFVACSRLSVGAGDWLARAPCPEPRDYHLVESILDAFRVSPDTKLVVGGGAGPNLSAIQWAVLERSELSDVYWRMYSANAVGSALVANVDARAEGKRDLDVGLATETYGPIFDEGLDGRIELVAVGRRQDEPLVHITWAVRSPKLDYRPDGRWWTLPLRLRGVLSDSSGTIVALIDSTVVYRSARPLPAEQFALGQLAIPVPAGNYVYRFALEEPGDTAAVVGMVTPRGPIMIAPVDGSGFALSDVAMGARDLSLAWPATPSDTAWFNPTASYASGGALEVYYEMYGVRPGEEYQVELTVVKRKGGISRLVGGRDPAIRVTFTERPTSTIARVNRTLGLSELKAGPYDLIVSVTPPGGQPVTRIKGFELRKD